MQSSLRATRVTTHTKLHGFSRQFLPRQIRVHKGYGESAHAARRAIVDQFRGPNWSTGGKILGLRERQKVPRGSVGFLSADWASNLRSALWANSDRIHEPDERELFAAQRTDSDKLKRHGALSLSKFGAHYNVSSRSLLGRNKLCRPRLSRIDLDKADMRRRG